jgi:hypothetical protein
MSRGRPTHRISVYTIDKSGFILFHRRVKKEEGLALIDTGSALWRDPTNTLRGIVLCRQDEHALSAIEESYKFGQRIGFQAGLVNPR